MVSNEENASSLYHFSFKCEVFQHYPLACAWLKLSWSFWKTTGRARWGGPRDQINQGMGSRVIRGSLLEDHSLWIRFMAVSARHLAAGRFELVSYIPSCSSWWDVMELAQLCLGCWMKSWPNPQIPWMDRQLLSCPFSFPEFNKAFNGGTHELLFSLQSCWQTLLLF